MPYSGTSGFLVKDGVAKPGKKWSADLSQVVVDRANFLTQGEPLNAAGQRSGEVTMSGPLERDPPGGNGPLAIIRGSLCVMQLGIIPGLFITVTVRISKYSITNDSDTGPEWSATGAQYGAATVDHI